jgi:hypothetical protein
MHGALRLGAAFPSGGFDAGSSFADNTGTQAVVLFDLGARIRPEDDVRAGWMIGGYLGFGFGGSGNATTVSQPGLSPGGSFSLHLGPEVQYHFKTNGDASPWIGYGLGLEVLALSFTAGDTTYKASFAALQFARPQIGVDWVLGPWVALGLYAEASFAQFGSGSLTASQPGEPDATATLKIVGPSVHEWIGLGVRAVLLP